MSKRRDWTGKGCADTYWTNSGRHFGYPECCIEAFLDDKQVFGTEFDGTGYVPCSKCAQKKSSELVETINNSRQHPEPFPHSKTFVEQFKDLMYDS